MTVRQVNRFGRPDPCCARNEEPRARTSLLSCQNRLHVRGILTQLAIDDKLIVVTIGSEPGTVVAPEQRTRYGSPRLGGWILATPLSAGNTEGAELAVVVVLLAGGCRTGYRIHRT
jgi:hypothetical protein